MRVTIHRGDPYPMQKGGKTARLKLIMHNRIIHLNCTHAGTGLSEENLYDARRFHTMKATLKRALISVFAVSLTFSSAVIPNMPGASMLAMEASAETVTAGQVKYGGNTFSYSLLASGNTVKLTGIVSLTEATCPLPSSVTVNGKSCAVVEIEKNFAQNANIRTISIPDSVKKIGFNFAAGAKIESVSIGKNVREIGESFCKNSPNLRSVSYSGTALQTLGSYAFEGTPFYNKPNANGAVTMGEWLIRYTGTAANVRVLNLANNKPDIHKIGSRAFYNNKKLTSVNLNGIQIIDSQACEGFGKLSKIEGFYSLTSL